jgi:hypothetical protein
MKSPVTTCVVILLLALFAAGPAFTQELRNDAYRLALNDDGSVAVRVEGAAEVVVRPEFTVLFSATDPGCLRVPVHPNYAVAPRVAVRWRKSNETLEGLNAWVGSDAFEAVTGVRGSVTQDGKDRAWEFRDDKGNVKVRVAKHYAQDTTRALNVGTATAMRPSRSEQRADGVRWQYDPQPHFTLSAELTLPPGSGDPLVRYHLTPKRAGYYSVVYTGAPALPKRKGVPVPQECAARGYKQFDYVITEVDLHLPRAHVGAADVNVAIVADPSECRFRLPTIADSRFGLMLQSVEASDGKNDLLRPVIIAPLLGGYESKMSNDATSEHSFGFRVVVRPGNWTDTYAHIARDVHGLRDQRDNTGPGSLNGTLERVIDFLADRSHQNHALWDPEQKYYDYYTNKTGVFKPFSPLYGLSAAIVTDDETFFDERALPTVEYALSRRTSVFAPYEAVDNKQANSAGRQVGEPYVSHAQLLSLDAMFQGRNLVLRALADEKAPAKSPATTSIRLGASVTEEAFFNAVERADATHDEADIRTAREAAYHQLAKINLYPVPPATSVTVDRGGHAPVHFHSYGRHKNIWGYPRPVPIAATEQTVPAWRIARVGVPGIAYPIEYWMNMHGAIMHTAGLARDPLLRDVARWGMVGRFGNFPGDNRSIDSLVGELPDAVDRKPWEWNFATVNPGHAWDFAAQVLDFLVSDAFERSQGAIDFPSESAAGSLFRTRIYGAKPGQFYGEHGVRLWLPRGLVTSTSRQLDYIAAYRDDTFYLAVWNQSFEPVEAELTLDDKLVECKGEAQTWRDNVPGKPLSVLHNRVTVKLTPKGILALKIPAKVKPRLQARLYDKSLAPLGTRSFAQIETPFGPVHAMLLRSGRGRTTAFVYTEALPEKVIAARLRWRQGDGDWRDATDAIYPYEFTVDLRDDAGDFAFVFEVEDEKSHVLSSHPTLLAFDDASTTAPPSAPRRSGPIASVHASQPAPKLSTITPPSDEFVRYLQSAANVGDFGKRDDGRFYPYSTPLGRRIGWRQIVWDKAHYDVGCDPADAERAFRNDLLRTAIQLQKKLAERSPAVDFNTLDERQRETLLDLAVSNGVAGLSDELLECVLARDWNRMTRECLYIRYAGHAPDHARNRAFAKRWEIE